MSRGLGAGNLLSFGRQNSVGGPGIQSQKGPGGRKSMAGSFYGGY